MTSRTELIEMLVQGPLKVTFRKKDGTTRVMNCTLSQSIVPKYERKTPSENNQTDREKRVNENVIAVWDIENQGWRSFNIDSVIEINK